MSRPIRVLLLEDDDADAELTRRTLERAGFHLELTRAGTRKEFEAALTAPLDIVISDYQLPDMNALVAVMLLRERGVHAPVLLVTGYLEEETAALLLREGCSDYVLKDHLSRLPGAFSQCLEKKRLADRTRTAEARLRQREARFRGLIDNSTEFIVLVDARGTVLEMLGARMLGYSDEQVVGRSAFDLVHPDDIVALQSTFEALVREPRTVRSAEFRVRGAEGEWLWLATNGRNLLDEPDVRAVVLTTRDVSERHRMLEALEQGRDLLRADAALLEGINGAMAGFLAGGDLDAATRALLGNLREVTRTPQAFVLMVPDGGGVLPALEPADGPLAGASCEGALRDLYAAMSASPEVASLERPCACLSDAHALLAVPIRVGLEARGMLGVICRQGEVLDRDRSHLESIAQTLGVLQESHRRALRHDLLERELLQSQKMEAVGRLAGGVAHDFNNLLTAIIGFGEMAMCEVRGDSSVGGCVAEMVGAAERAATLTRQLLAFSRRHVVAPRNLNLDTVIEELSKMLGRLIGEDIQLEMKPAGDLEDVIMDPGLVEQIVLNLAVNARDAMPHGGVLEISTAGEALDEAYAERHPDARVGPHVRLRVKDSGTDVIMPGMNGREVAEAVVAKQPRIRLLFMSGYTDDAVVRAGVAWRDVPFLQKPFTRASLLARVEEALEQSPGAAKAHLAAEPAGSALAG